jgi:hypothetical protein
VEIFCVHLLVTELTDAERDVFSHVKTIPYKVTLLKIDKLTRGHHLRIREHVTQKDRDGRSNDGNVVLLSNPHKENNVYIAYQFTEQGKTSDFRAISLANVNQIGGQAADRHAFLAFLYYFSP